MGNVEPGRRAPRVVNTKRFIARTAQATRLERGNSTRVWVDLEYFGKPYVPGEDDLLVTDLTSGWMRRKLFCQGLKQEVDDQGRRRWCLFIYQPTEGNVDYIREGFVVAKVTSQHLDTDWPTLMATSRRSNQRMQRWKPFGRVSQAERRKEEGQGGRRPNYRS